MQDEDYGYTRLLKGVVTELSVERFMQDHPSAKVIYDQPYATPMKEAIPETARAFTHILVGGKSSADSKTFAVAAAGLTSAIMAVRTVRQAFSSCTSPAYWPTSPNRLRGTVDINGVHWCVATI